MVKNNGDYSVHMADPDLLVDWSKIEEIHIDTHELMSCPICLHEPTAGKMTKCGHIYCWSCILHYLSLSDKAWRKCPICFESIYKNDLKSVRVIKHKNEFKVGDELEFNLMFKSKSKYNTLILPIAAFQQAQADEKLNKQLTFGLLNADRYQKFRQYFKLHAKSETEIYDEVLRRERSELEAQIEAEKDQPEVCFAHEALDLLEKREIEIKAEIGSKSPSKPVQKSQSLESADQVCEIILKLVMKVLTKKSESPHKTQSFVDLSFFICNLIN